MKKHTLATAITVALSTFPVIADEQDEIERLSVVSSRIEMPLREIATSVTIVTKEDIEARGYANLADVLKVQPSVTATNSGGVGTTASLRIRGEEGFRTQIRLDGIEISDPTGTQIGPRVGQLQSANISRVEILRGTQGLAYGADAGGVVNIQSGGYTDTIEGSLGGEFGRFGTQNVAADVGGQSGKIEYYVAASDFSTDGFNSRLDDATEDEDGYDNTTIHSRFAFNVNDQLSFGLVARNTSADGEFDNCGFGATASNNCQSAFEQTNLRFNANYTTEHSSHELAYGKTLVERDFLNQSVSTFLTKGTLERLEYLGNTQINDNISVVYGVDWKEETITSGDVSRENLGYHAELQSEIVDNFYVTAGARLDDNDDFGEHLSYRLSSAYIWLLGDDELKLRGAYGTGFRAPSLSELAYNRGAFAFPPASTTDLKEETTNGYEVAMQYTWAEGSNVELVYFDQQIEDSIFFDLAGFSGYLQDLGTAESAGVEFVGLAKINDNLTLNANFTYNNTEQTDGSQRVRRPARVANIGIDYQAGKLKFSANFRRVSGFVDIADTQLDDYHVLDISARYYLDENFEAFARIENFFNADYQDVAAFNTSGLAPHLGIKYQF